MPELPEVETVMRGLKPVLEGRRIERVMLRRKDLRFPFPDGFKKALEGAVVERIERRSKYLLWHITERSGAAGMALVHLGMSGRFSMQNIPPRGYMTHDHVVWFLDDGKVLVYNDTRRFGIIDYCMAADLPTHPLLAHLGPEPLTSAFSAAHLSNALMRKTQAIKPALMDASVVVGVGNIYASEACHLAGIHPETSAGKIAVDKKRCNALVKAVKQVLDAAIHSGGSSLKDFWHVDGGGGYFQHQFQVYGRKGEPCRRCAGMIQQITQAGRSSFFCTSCQEK
jgi:formamidopyrimidine-DNA glycosylase